MSKLTSTNFFPELGGGAKPLDVATVPDSPLRLLDAWVEHVLEIGAVEPMFVTLATSDARGNVSSRTVQLLAVEAETLLFTTNFGSRKGVEMLETGRAAVSLYWRETAQSVNVTGAVEIADDEENDARFAAEDRAVQVARTVSFHGKPLEDEAAQLEAFRAMVESDAPIPRPDYWKWFRIRPDAVTFWEGHPGALNRRVHYAAGEAGWTKGMVQA